MAVRLQREAKMLRIAVRRLLRSPGLTVAAVVTLALGVAAYAAIFALVEATLLRPLPYPGAERLFALQLELRRESGAIRIPWSWPRFAEFRRLAPIEDAAAYSDVSLTLGGAAGAERVAAEIVSPSYFALLGVQPLLGRALDAATEPAAVLSHELWKRRFGGDPAVIGRTLEVNRGHTLTIVGVAPRGFRGLSLGAELWVPVDVAPALVFANALEDRAHWLTGVAKLPRGAAPESARKAAALLLDRLEEAVPEKDRASLSLVSLQDSLTDPTLRRAALVLLAAVTLLLAIAAANVSNLLLARAAARSHDVAIRRALGAGHGRLVADFLSEGALLAGAGAALGLVLAVWGVDALLALRPATAEAAFWRDLTPDAIHLGPKVVLVAAAVSVASGLLAALPAAAQASRGAVADALRGSVAGRPSGRLDWLSGRGALVVVQLAVALVLALGASLLVRSFSRLRSVEPGFDPAGVVALRLYQAGGQDPAVRGAFLGQLLERVQALPGVAAATVDRCLPLTGACDLTAVSRIQGQPPFDEGLAPEVGIHFVGPGHLASLGARLLEGRFLTAADRAGTPRVLVLDAAAAHRLFPKGHALGQRLETGQGDAAEVVGVVANVRYGRPQEALAPQLFFSAFQDGFPGTWLLLRARPGLRPETIAAAARRTIAELDPELAISPPRLMQEVAADATAPQRFAAVLLATFATLAMALAATGVYGALSVSVGQRRREIGIRMALGARRAEVISLVALDSLRLTVAGLTLGVAIAAASLRALSSLLYGVSPADPLAAIASAAALLAVALAATLLPAWRGATVDPAIAMRAE